jgi:Ca-activated chloride channel family protein
VWALIGSLFLGAAILAQDQIPQQPAPPVRRLNLIVLDQSKRAVGDLQPDQVQLFEDKILGKITSVVKDERPVDYALAIDCSGSFRKLLPATIDVGKTILNSNRADDETFIERFISADKIDTVEEFTSEKYRLLRGLASIYIEGGQSAVIDGVYLAAKHVAEHRPDPNRKQALVLITDGEDRQSYYSEAQLIQLLSENEVQVFVVGITFQLGSPSREKAERLLERLAQTTGGRAIFPKNVSELGQVANEIAQDLHSQYLVSYESANTGTNNYRAIEVRITDVPGHAKLTAITRPGYFVNPPKPGVKEKDKKKSK